MNTQIDVQIQERVSRLLDALPVNGTHEVELRKNGSDWIFKFGFVSFYAVFNACGVAPTPDLAISQAEAAIEKQIEEWREVRFTGQHYEGSFNGTTDGQQPKVTLRHSPHRLANILIVDDDIDMALEMETIFKRLGCRTLVANDIHEAEKFISYGEPDIIILDWMLDDDVRADQVVESSIRNIEFFEDLKEQFVLTKPKVISYSGLTDFQITFPKSYYFDYLGHWQKPTTYAELTTKATRVLADCGF